MRIRVDIARQVLDLFDRAGVRVRRYPISSAAKGLGELRGSHCTPRGRHVVRARIGGGQPANTVFVGRRPTGETYSPELAAAQPERDWILTRILWLSGCERGRNRLGEVDTMRRFIYIHGCPDDATLGVPQSHGCIRMRNRDIVELFDLVGAGTPVEIDAETVALEVGGWAALAASAQAIRDEVFVGEQGVPVELEHDGRDPDCLHVVAFADGARVGTGRLLPDGHIGRMAVRAAWRGRGIGRRMLEALMQAAARRGDREVVLNAQTSALGFYQRLGFEAFGPVFVEAGLEHQGMRRRLSAR